jgi:hypothetical protein
MPQEKWALVLHLSTFLTQLFQSIGMTAVIASNTALPPYSSANSIFAISVVMGFVVEARHPEVGMAPNLLRPNTGRIRGHKKQKGGCLTFVS